MKPIMNDEKRIREAFEIYKNKPMVQDADYSTFKAGYKSQQSLFNEAVELLKRTEDYDMDWTFDSDNKEFLTKIEKNNVRK